MKLSLNSNDSRKPADYGFATIMVAPACDTLLPLDLMKPGQSASIVELHGDCQQVHRLQEMGLRTGAVVRMVKPGAPCLVALDGKRLSLRLGDLLDILVAVPAA